MSNTYTVRYEQDEAGWWVASVQGVRGCHTQGRSIRQAEERIREALSLFVDDADRATLKASFVLPADARRRLAEIRKLEEKVKRHAQLLREVVAVLTDSLNMSRRDAGAVLGLSHQRIQQLVDPKPKQRPSRRTAPAQ